MDIYKIKIDSVNKGVYECDAIVLSSTNLTRTIFSPVITPKGIDGQIIYEKKDPSGNWASICGINRTNMKKGEWTKVRLSTEELANLINYVTSLKEFKDTGLVDSFNHFLIVGMFRGFSSEEIEKLKKIIQENPAVLRKLIELNDKSPIDVNDILSTINSNFEVVGELIQKMDSETIDKIRVASRIRLLDTTKLEEMILNKSSEENFQKFFTDNPEILSLVIPSLIHCIQSKPYCGGKDISGSGGTFGDFLFGERNNLSFVEIKTPECGLVTEKNYRNGIKEISQEICNAVIQVKHEKDLFYKTMVNQHGFKDSFFDCKCYVIAGLSSSLTDNESVASFELYKTSLHNVTIITYDEVVETIKRLSSILME